MLTNLSNHFRPFLTLLALTTIFYLYLFSLSLLFSEEISLVRLERYTAILSTRVGTGLIAEG